MYEQLEDILTLNAQYMERKMKNLLAKKTLSEQFAEGLGAITTETILILIGLIRIIAKLLFKFRKWEWRLLVILFILSKLYTTFLTHVNAPKAFASLDHPNYKIVTRQLSLFEQHRDYILSQSHGDIVLRIWDNETTKGQNNTQDPTALHQYCKKLGKTNEFGFNPFNHQCFDTFEESVNTVNQWLDDCLQTRTLGACLERYSGNSKSYVERFLDQTN